MNLKICSLFLLALSLIACKNNVYIPPTLTAIKGERIPIDNTIIADTSIENYIKPYAQHLNSTLDSVLAYNPTSLDKNDGKLNTALGNMMADLIMEQANPIFKSRTGKNIDMVLLNHGGIRSGIGKGAVTTRTGFKLMPFENEIVVVELSGKKLLEMLTYLENAKTAHPISGLELKVDRDFKTMNATINGELIKAEETYFVATSDYLQQGGDNMVFFKNPINLFRIDYKLRNAIIDHFKKVDTLKASIDNRYIQIP
ncbi:5'-nucleotidase [Gillisia sp. Hel_I_86]|uniref:5'-nucleotidase C-terminal domain-containing protein n=1 Tax=Gillisia sp. Hel_I_86 TaxID=1249981 RepID=UPI001199F375|nr:5'-nucleotidase [Gillisia sp. Hel_I_86]TVZ25367.1 5'-nucleotidase [Gillisia sp. Hel_I_86]